DFFSGNWSESRALTGGPNGNNNSNSLEGGEGGGAGGANLSEDIFFMDEGNSQQYIDYEDRLLLSGIAGRDERQYYAYNNNNNNNNNDMRRSNEDDLGSHQSFKSIDTVNQEDIRAI